MLSTLILLCFTGDIDKAIRDRRFAGDGARQIDVHGKQADRKVFKTFMYGICLEKTVNILIPCTDNQSRGDISFPASELLLFLKADSDFRAAPYTVNGRVSVPAGKGFRSQKLLFTVRAVIKVVDERPSSEN